MIHFTCDMCGKEMPEDAKERYVVRIDVRPANSPWELSEEDIDEDNLEKVSQLLKAEEEESESSDSVRPEAFHLDLCAPCRQRFVENPLSSRAAPKFDFSEN
ncbi:MAG: hypothetical protein U1D30_10395 [Planctomycetota bacterium]